LLCFILKTLQRSNRTAEAGNISREHGASRRRVMFFVGLEPDRRHHKKTPERECVQAFSV